MIAFVSCWRSGFTCGKGHACAIWGGGMLSTECSGRLTGWPGGGVNDLPKDGPRAVSKCGAGLGLPDSNSGFTGRLDSNTGGSVFARGWFRVSGAGSLVTISMRGSAPRAHGRAGSATAAHEAGGPAEVGGRVRQGRRAPRTRQEEPREVGGQVGVRIVQDLRHLRSRRRCHALFAAAGIIPDYSAAQGKKQGLTGKNKHATLRARCPKENSAKQAI